MHSNNNIKHGDLDIRQSPQTWMYTDIVEAILYRMGTVYAYSRSGTINGMSRREFFKELEQYAPQRAYLGVNGAFETQLLTSTDRSILIECEISRQGRNIEKASLKIATDDNKIITHFLKWGKKHLININGNTVYCIGQGQHGLVLQDIGKIRDELVRDNYDIKVLDKADYIVEQLNSDTPKGRLTIINGLPGCGKTYLIKGIIPRIKNALVILLPTRLISEVDGPALVSLLAEWKSDYGYDLHSGESTNPAIVLILEDADDCLTVRNASNMSTVSSVLNHTDGIFGSMLDLRLIATTNAHQIEFDKAFTRPGRLCTHITIDRLSPEHAEEVYTRISGGKKKKYTKPATLAEVYADANENPYGFIEEDKRMGFT